jgi:hypothetical protein
MHTDLSFCTKHAYVDILPALSCIKRYPMIFIYNVTHISLCTVILSMTPNKKTVNAKLFVHDVQQGMSKLDLQRKYDLSESELGKIYQKLSDRGLLEKHTIELSREEFLKNHVQPVQWRCPSCGTVQNKVYEECPHCGIIVAKYEKSFTTAPYT